MSFTFLGLGGSYLGTVSQPKLRHGALLRQRLYRLSGRRPSRSRTDELLSRSSQVYLEVHRYIYVGF